MAGVTNITRGPRFIYASGKPLLLDAGETKDLALRDNEIKNVQHQVDAGVLAWDGEAPKAKAEGGGDKKSATDLTAADLLAKVNSMEWLAFRHGAVKLLGEGAPTTKAELIAALEAKAKAEGGEG